MKVKLAALHYYNPLDEMTHADLYLEVHGAMQWAGHMVLPRGAWIAFGRFLSAGNEHSATCQVDVREAWRWQRKEAN